VKPPGQKPEMIIDPYLQVCRGVVGSQLINAKYDHPGKDDNEPNRFRSEEYSLFLNIKVEYSLSSLSK
jgi:hypothetical protein